MKSGPERFLPTGWQQPSGYAHAVAAQGRLLTLAGQIGWNPYTHTIESDDFVTQARQALENIAAILESAGARTDQVTRITWYITDRDAYLAELEALGAAYRGVFGDYYPAMSVVVVAGLLEPRALVEIEATAVVPDSR